MRSERLKEISQYIEEREVFCQGSLSGLQLAGKSYTIAMPPTIGISLEEKINLWDPLFRREHQAASRRSSPKASYIHRQTLPREIARYCYTKRAIIILKQLQNVTKVVTEKATLDVFMV